MTRLLRRFLNDDSGATSLEYGLIISLIFLVALTALTAFGGAGGGVMNTAMATLRAGMGGG